MPLSGKNSPCLDELTEEDLRGEGMRFKGKLVGVAPLFPESLFDKLAPTPQERATMFSICVESMAMASKLQKKARSKKTKVFLQISTDSGMTVTKRSRGKELAVYAPSNMYIAIPDPNNNRHCAFVVRGDLNLEILVFKSHKKTKVDDLCSLFNRLFEETGRELRDRAKQSQLAKEAADSIRLRLLQRKPLQALEDSIQPDSADVSSSSVEEEKVVLKTETKNGDLGDKLPEITALPEKSEMNGLMNECANEI